MEDGLNFKGGDPGAVRYGNFINYYQFNSTDSRLKLLPTDIWNVSITKPYICLDIGCNSGDLTQELYKFLSKNVNKETSHSKSSEHTDKPDSKCHILGVDLDPILIKRATDSNQYPQNVVYRCIDFLNDNNNEVIEFLNFHKKKMFDVIFCFSVTMWIHLNNGDEGLRQFLISACSQTTMIVLEPQPWKCYRTAVRRMKRSSNASFPLFQDLKIRNNVTEEIENIVCNYCKFVKIQETVSTEWGRRLQFFKRME